MESIQIMSLTEGDETLYFDPKNKKDVEKALKRVKELLEEGYYAYVREKDGSCRSLNPKDIKNITDEQLSEFVLAKAKKVVTNPETGG